jgi:hypothetical protein
VLHPAQEDIFYHDFQNLGEIQEVEIEHDNSGAGESIRTSARVKGGRCHRRDEAERRGMERWRVEFRERRPCFCSFYRPLPHSAPPSVVLMQDPAGTARRWWCLT